MSTKTATNGVKMRKVHDVMWMFDAPVAYDIDHEKRQHQAVCPWCAEAIGEPFNLEVSTFGELYERLFAITAKHMKVCKNKDKPVDPFNDVKVEAK